MLKTITNIIMVICLIIMVVSILVYYQSPIGRALVVISSIIAIATYFVSDYLEDKEEES